MALYTARPGDGAVWITGASSGIGRHLALKLAGAGYMVVATARRADELQALAGEAAALAGRIVVKPGDVTQAEEMERICAEIGAEEGALVLAILNAGVYLPVAGEWMQVKRFTKSFDVNLKGVVNALVPAVDLMKQAGRGQIAIVSSVAGHGGLPTSAAYGATKAALTNLAESLKFDLDKMNIRLQIVHPGFVDTPATKNNPFPMPALMDVEDAADRIVSGLGRGGFEITFPRRFTYFVKLLRLLPYPAYFGAVNRFTGWSKRPLKKDE